MAVTGDYWVGKLYDSLRRFEWERIQSREIEPQLSLLPQLESSNVQAQNYGSSTRNSGYSHQGDHWSWY
ncbi:hypothetical protein P8452_29467 [Trifolium repens]|nr:hypothetical protein P8452_29467 [Trifolium repens]